MELNKIAKYQAKNEPYLKPISDLGIGFYNLDENTATLQFQIYNDNGPLLISDENVDVHGYFKSSNGSVSTVDKLNVVDGMNGIAQITLDKKFLQASTSTKVTGQIYVAVNNVTEDTNNNQTAVLGEFTFQVADALINKVSSFTKVEYIRMFDQLREEIKQRTKEMEDDIGNIKTLVNEVEDAVADGKADITKIKDNSVSELEEIANTTNTSVRQEASQAISDIQSTVDEYTTKLNDETNDKINEVNEASDKVLESVKQNNLVTLEQTDNWQKYRLTQDDGTIKYVPKGTITDIKTLEPGLYETVSDDDATNQDIPINNSYVQIKVWEGGRGRKEIELTSTFNGAKYFRLIHTEGEKDTGWKEIPINPSDTGWLPITIKNGYNKAVNLEYEPSYRVIDYGAHKKVFVRLGVTNLKNSKNIVASIPNDLNPYNIYSLGTSTIAKIPPKVLIREGNIEIYPNANDEYTDNDYVIYQGEWVI